MSGIVNKIKEAVHSDNKATHGAPEGTHGPHNSRIANAMDPRVDSDRDGSRKVGPNTGRTAGHGEFGSNFGSGNTGTATSEGLHGPHSSRVANAMDPRVDSDRDGSRNMGAAGGFSSTGNNYGSGPSSGVTGMTGTHGDPAGTHGPHGSRLSNIADPRVDSDRDGRGAIGTGPHNSDMLNKADPRVDSDLDGSRTLGGNKTYQ